MKSASCSGARRPSRRAGSNGIDEAGRQREAENRGQDDQSCDFYETLESFPVTVKVDFKSSFLLCQSRELNLHGALVKGHSRAVAGQETGCISGTSWGSPALRPQLQGHG